MNRNILAVLCLAVLVWFLAPLAQAATHRLTRDFTVNDTTLAEGTPVDLVSVRGTQAFVKYTDAKGRNTILQAPFSILEELKKEEKVVESVTPEVERVPPTPPPTEVEADTGGDEPEAESPWKPGAITKVTTSGTHAVSYHVAIPEGFDPKKPPPVLVLFSPGGGGRGILEKVRPSAGKVGWTAVGVDKLKNDMKEELDLATEKEVFEHILENVPCHPGRIYLGGMSGGAMRAYGMSYRFNEAPIAGILAMGGWLGGEKYLDQDYRKYMAVAIVNGDKDKGANSWVKRDSDALEGRRCEVEVFQFNGGHTMPPAETLDQALAWMEEDWRQRGSKKRP